MLSMLGLPCSLPGTGSHYIMSCHAFLVWCVWCDDHVPAGVEDPVSPEAALQGTSKRIISSRLVGVLLVM